jgi:hypothetical protein
VPDREAVPYGTAGPTSRSWSGHRARPSRCRCRVPARASARAKARTAARELRSARGTVRLVVRRGAARSAKAVLRAEGRRYRVVRGGGRVTFLVGGGRDRSGDEHPWARTLEGALRDAGVRVVMFRAP